MCRSAAARHQHVKPPVVRDDIDVRPGFNEELAGGLIEHHGVAAGDALHQRIAKRRRFGKQGRQTRLDAGLIHQAGAATVQCRPIRRDGLQPG